MIREIIFTVLGTAIGAVIVWRLSRQEPGINPALVSRHVSRRRQSTRRRHELLLAWAGIGLCVLILACLGGC